MATTFDYSPLGQLIARKSPDEGKTEFLYDSEGKVRFSQNADQATGNRYTYVNYDVHGRSVESGEYSWTSGGVKFQNFYSLPYVTSGDSVLGKLNELDGLDDGRCAQVNYIYYYPLASGEEIPAGYDQVSSYVQKQQYVMGRVVKTKNSNNQTWYNYDQFGRQSWTVQRIMESVFTTLYTDVDSQIKTLDYTYDIYGLLSQQDYQKNKANERIIHYFTYDADRRLTDVDIYTDGGTTRKQQAAYSYYLTGGLKRKEIGNSLQGLDYVYTINGQLKSINHPSGSTAKDPGGDGSGGSSFDADLFGMALDYYKDDYLRNNTNIVSSIASSTDGYYNGLIKATRWKTTGKNTIVTTDTILYPTDSTAHELMFRYSYDNIYQLATANFGVYKTSTSTFTARNEYKVWGGSSGDSIRYDLNGNITRLARNGFYKPSYSTYNMDSLFYTYTSNTNKLASIVDNSTVGSAG